MANKRKCVSINWSISPTSEKLVPSIPALDYSRDMASKTLSYVGIKQESVMYDVYWLAMMMFTGLKYLGYILDYFQYQNMHNDNNNHT
jgi:hypothetical protein